MVDYKNMFNLEGKRAVVVGGGGGIGGAIAEGFAAVGVKVAIVGRSLEKLEKKAAQIKADTGADVLCLAGDMGNEADVAKVCEDAKAAMAALTFWSTPRASTRSSPLWSTPSLSGMRCSPPTCVPLCSPASTSARA